MKVKDATKLISQQTLQRIQESYSLALGLPISIKDIRGNTLVPAASQGKLWDLIKGNTELQGVFAEQLFNSIEKCYRTGQIVVFERHPDCHAFLAPIYAGGKIIAFFLSGMVRFGNPNLDTAEKASNTLHIEIDTYLDAFLNLPFFTLDRLQASANLIRIIGSTIYNLEGLGSEIKEKNQEIQEENHKLNQNLLQTANKLLVSENRYKQIFDTVNDGIYIADFDKDTFLEINQAGAQILGYKNPHELIGKIISKAYANPNHRQNFKDILIKEKKVSNWIVHVLLPDGQQKFVETNATLLTDEQTGKQIIQGIFRDLGSRQHRSL